MNTSNFDSSCDANDILDSDRDDGDDGDSGDSGDDRDSGDDSSGDDRDSGCFRFDPIIDLSIRNELCIFLMKYILNFIFCFHYIPNLEYWKFSAKYNKIVKIKTWTSNNERVEWFVYGIIVFNIYCTA